MTSSINNPFIAGNPVKTSDMFFGRQDVFDFIEQHLIGRYQNNPLVLFGQPRSGKTSVLYQMHRFLDSKYLPVLVDLQGFTLEGLEGFLWELASTIYSGLPNEIKGKLEQPNRQNYLLGCRPAFNDFLDQIFPAIGNRYLLLMFDETARLTEAILAGRMQRSVIDYLSSLIQKIENLNFIFSLGTQLEKMKQEFGTLFVPAIYKRISFLDPEAARQLITKPVNGVFTYNEEAIQHIVHLTHGNPYYIQLVCHSLFNRYQTKQIPQIGLQDVKDVIAEVLERGLVNLKFIWDDATTLEQQIMSALVSQEETILKVPRNELPYTLRRHISSSASIEGIAQAIDYLVDKEVITSAGPAKILLPLVKLWIEEKGGISFPEDSKPLPVLAIMGTKGGVGKTTIAARMAELIAEAGNNVLVIDFDISDAGSTIFHSSRQKHTGDPLIRTVLDHVLPYSKHNQSVKNSSSSNDLLWDVTPLYIAEKDGTGQIYLIPARPLNVSITGKWEAIADIEAGRRSDILLDELNRMLRRATPDYKIDCVIIDCGAEFNPLVSAAFYHANHGFIVTLPNLDFARNINDIKEEHISRYPDTRIRKIDTIVNRAESERDVERWGAMNPVGFVPDDPQLYEDWTRGTTDFDLGYDNISLAILSILTRTLGRERKYLIPDEIDIWIAPWMRQIVDRKLPERVLKSPEFTRVLRVSLWGLITAIIMVITSLFFILRFSISPSASLEDGQAKISIISVSSMTEVQELQNLLSEGKEFEALAKVYSNDSATKQNNGVVADVVDKNEIITGIGVLPGLERCIELTTEGQVCSDILESNNNFFLIRMVAKGEGKTPFLVRSFLPVFGLLGGVGLAVWCFVIYRSQNRRRALLLEVEAHGDDKQYLKSLLDRSTEKGPLRWLHTIWSKAIDEERKTLRQTRHMS